MIFYLKELKKKKKKKRFGTLNSNKMFHQEQRNSAKKDDAAEGRGTAHVLTMTHSCPHSWHWVCSDCVCVWGHPPDSPTIGDSLWQHTLHNFVEVTH